ncbi:eukaryotic type KH-domain (KH-domain type I) [Hypoxylon sp. FL1150]|nr:eukaryotic type KH-domain (KH-domain type I) [Hypoxylon sp. FL1150]
MSEGQPNVQAILAALAAAQTGTSTTPSQGAPYAVPGYQQPPPAYPMPPTTQPQYASGSYPNPYDLSGIRPVNSGTVQINDAIAQAKIYAAEKGLQPYERPSSAAYQQPHDSRTMDRRYRSRSRSPVRRDNYRDNSNPYRDERRNDRAAREYGRDRSMSPGISRGRSSGAVFSPRGASGRDRDDDDSEIIDIESSLVGLIIGRNGENLRRVESETSCRVQFMSPTSEGGPTRQCKITGPRPRRAEAKASIHRIIEDSGMGALARAGLDKTQPSRRDGATPGLSALREGEECTQIMVPDRTVGLIIGRGGETIRDLQERSGCHINIVGESKSVQGLRPVNLIGPPHASAMAKDFILEIVDSDSRNGNAGATDHTKGRPQKNDHGRDNGSQMGDKINDSIYVPSEAVGMIIGKGGETIREMQNTTSCKINVSQSTGPGETEREIGLVGSRDSINRAKRAIEDKVEAVRQKNSGGAGGGRRGQNNHRRDWDNPNNSSYGNHSASNQHAPVDNQQPPAAAAGTDPYAMYGGYQQYMTLWYQALSQQNQQGGPPQGDAPPGI